MFGSHVLEVGIGLVFTFLSISLISGAVVEAIASVMRLRANTLVSGVKALLNDPNFTGLAKDLYDHAAVHPRGSGASAALAPAGASGPKGPVKPPAYIDRQQFAAALMDITGMSTALAALAAAAPSSPVDSAARIKALTDAVGTKLATGGALNKQIRDWLLGIINRSLGDAVEIKKELAEWFDSAMDRISGVYKRYTQYLTVGIALVLAVVLNVNSITIAKAVWEQPTLTDNLKPPPVTAAAAGAAVPTDADKAKAVADAKAAADAKATADATAAAAALRTLDRYLPVGWPHGVFMTAAKDTDGKDIVKDGQQVYQGFGTRDILVSILGWLITAISALFGAPFWFDALQQITRLKGSGPSPAEKQSGTAASH